LWSSFGALAGRACRALWSSFAALAGRACRPLCTGLTLRALRTYWTLRAGRADFATLTGGALGANGSLRALGALRSGRTDWTWGAGRAERARWALWPGRRFAAPRDCQYCEQGGKLAYGGAAKPFATHALRMQIAAVPHIVRALSPRITAQPSLAASAGQVLIAMDSLQHAPRFFEMRLVRKCHRACEIECACW
jgi:hypothetical protein